MSGSGDGKVLDGTAAGEADVINTTPTTEYGLVVRFPSLPTGTNVIGGVTGSGNFTVVQPTGTNLHIVCDSGCGAAATFADEATFSIGVTSITIMGALVDEVTPDSAPEGSAAAPRMSTNRVLYSILRDAAGNERGANVDASFRLTVLADQGGAWTVTANAGTNLNTSALALDATLTGRLPAGSTPADNESNAVTTTRAGALLFCFDGTTWDRCPGNSVDGLLVNLGANNDVTVTSGSIGVTSFPDNEPFNLAQVGGTAILTGNGVTGAGSPRVTIASDNTAFTVNVGTFPDNEPINVAQIAGSATTTVAVGTQKVGVADDAGTAIPSSTASPLTTARGLHVRQVHADPCRTKQATPLPISVTANTQLIAGVASQHVFFCSINIGPIGTATNVAIVSGTGAVCVTSTAGVFGGVTAATGWNFAANGGVVLGNGDRTIGRTETAADAVCILVSAANQVSGSIMYVQE